MASDPVPHKDPTEENVPAHSFTIRSAWQVFVDHKKLRTLFEEMRRGSAAAKEELIDKTLNLPKLLEALLRDETWQSLNVILKYRFLKETDSNPPIDLPITSMALDAMLLERFVQVLVDEIGFSINDAWSLPLNHALSLARQLDSENKLTNKSRDVADTDDSKHNMAIEIDQSRIELRIVVGRHTVEILKPVAMRDVGAVLVNRVALNHLAEGDARVFRALARAYPNPLDNKSLAMSIGGKDLVSREEINAIKSAVRRLEAKLDKGLVSVTQVGAGYTLADTGNQ